MDNNINKYFSNLSYVYASIKGELALTKYIRDMKANREDVLYVFISDTHNNKLIDDKIWLFTEKYIILFQGENNERRYKIIPINRISNISLSFYDIDMVIEFNYSGNTFSLTAHEIFNSENLWLIYNNVLCKSF